MPIAIANYATFAQVQPYAPGIPSDAGTQTLIVSLSAAASRFIDSVTGQWFYVEQTATKYFHLTSPSGEMQGGPQLSTMQPFYTPTAIQLAYFENQPLSQWLTLTGDGVTPPTNFYLWPPNPRTYSAAGTAYYKPYWGVDLAHLPSPNTTFLPIYIGGYKTAAITASWGWPAVPDVITDLTCKMVVRAWRAVQSGHQLEAGSPEIGGVVNMGRHFDQRDLEVLAASDLIATAI